MKIRLFPALCLALTAQVAPVGASFGGHYAIPMNGTSPLYSTSNSVSVGNWTLASSSPGTVVVLQRSPADPSRNASGFVLTTSNGATASLTITSPENPYDCISLLSMSVNLRPSGALWILDGAGPHILADTPGLYAVDNLFPYLLAGRSFGFFVVGSSETSLQVQTGYIGWLPEATLERATAISAVSATLNGSVLCWDLPTQAWFEWGQDDFDQSTPQMAIGSLVCRTNLSFTLQGLQPDTTYQFRLAATNGFAESRTAPLTFTTARLPVINGAAVSPGGTFQLDFTGTAGALYTVWATTKLPHWQSLGPGSEVSPGQFRFTDPATAGGHWRFYRVSSP